MGFGMKRWSWGFAVLLMVANMAVSGATIGGVQCKEERNIAVKECLPVVYGRLPTPACCERARISHIECICPAVTPKVAAFVDVNRAVRLIEGCGRKIPRHFKCGSIVTP